MKVSEIKVGKRFRKDLGDLSALCESIEKIGLLHPIVVTPDGELIVGVRRLAAYKKLGRDNIPTRTIASLADAVSLLVAERDENTCRKDFLPTEAVALGEKLESLERPKMKERHREGSARGGKGGGKLPQPSAPTKTRDRVAPAIGMSPRSYEKAKRVVEAAETDPERFGELPALMDKEGRVDRAYRELREKENRARAEELRAKARALPTGTYQVLYGDPPWRYEHAVSKSRAIENQYPTMTLEEIKSLKVPADPNCVLFLWATSPKLAEALSVIEAWGFSYRTCAVWVKDKIGMGYYFRQQHELLLVCVKGNPGTPEQAARASSVISEPRTKHSAKPVEVYELIEKMYPTRSRCELWARGKRDGWDGWGYEA